MLKIVELLFCYNKNTAVGILKDEKLFKFCNEKINWFMLQNMNCNYCVN